MAGNIVSASKHGVVIDSFLIYCDNHASGKCLNVKKKRKTIITFREVRTFSDMC